MGRGDCYIYFWLILQILKYSSSKTKLHLFVLMLTRPQDARPGTARPRPWASRLRPKILALRPIPSTNPTISACTLDLISGHMNHYKVVYCHLQKMYRSPLKKITYLITRYRFLAQGQDLGWQGQAKGLRLQGKGIGLQDGGQKFWPLRPRSNIPGFIVLLINTFNSSNFKRK